METEYVQVYAVHGDFKVAPAFQTIKGKYLDRGTKRNQMETIEFKNHQYQNQKSNGKNWDGRKNDEFEIEKYK